MDTVHHGRRATGLYCLEYWFISGSCGLCIQRSEGAFFVLPSVGAAPSGSGALSFKLAFRLAFRLGDWNAILDYKTNRGKWNDRIMIDLIDEFGLVDRYQVDHTGWEMWMCLRRW